MNVLSLFDGMSCGQLALQRANIAYNNYYASEIDKYAIKVTQANYPKTVQLGDVCDIHGKNLTAIDLLMGGSPCQGFSFSGKQLNFEDPRSKLFFEYVRLLKETKPKYFLLENVRMAQKSKDIISNYLGVEPIEINSALVSAQNRNRLYWTNIPFTIPEDKGIFLQDIIENGDVLTPKPICIATYYYKGGNNSNSTKQFGKRTCIQIGYVNYGGQGDRIYDISGKSVTLSASGGGNGSKTGLYKVGETVRKLSPIECERLQTVPDNYTAHVSDTQRYKMLGNGWTVDVIAHILKGIIQ
jgi:DNA (cytosine-5)-methyltransferase 3A